MRSSTANASQPLTPSYQGRNSATPRTAPEAPVTHSPARSRRRSIAAGMYRRRRVPAPPCPSVDGDGHNLRMASEAGRRPPTAAIRLPLAGVAFLALADTAIVALALPPILRELDTDVAGVAAVLGVYAVVLAAALPVAEWLRRATGTRAVGVAGVVLFVAGSLVCGVAGSLDLLLMARGVQAAGGAALLITAYALLAGGAAGVRVWRLAVLLGTAAGPAIGGALTQAFGWRSIFLLQAPAALAALPGCARAERASESAAPPAGGWEAAVLARAAALALVSGAVAA